MSKIGPNESCPCGSNKKYKKCCRLKEPVPKIWQPEKQSLIPMWAFGEDPMDRDSNRIVDLIHEGRLDEAEEAAKRLLTDYPEINDGFDRLGMVYEKRGDYIRAIEMYQKALDFTLDHDGFDEEGRDFWREKIAELSTKG
jgi:tetratricopeptide (TPR) repeat protein